MDDRYRQAMGLGNTPPGGLHSGLVNLHLLRGNIGDPAPASALTRGSNVQATYMGITNASGISEGAGKEF